MNAKIVCFVLFFASAVMATSDEELKKLRKEAENQIIETEKDLRKKAKDAHDITYGEIMNLTYQAFQEKQNYVQSVMEGTSFELREFEKAAHAQASLLYFLRKNTTLLDCIKAQEVKALAENNQYFLVVTEQMQKEKEKTEMVQKKWLDIWTEETNQSFTKLKKSAERALNEISKTSIPSYITTIVDNFKKMAKETEVVVKKLEKVLTQMSLNFETVEYLLVDNYKVVSRSRISKTYKNMKNCF